MVDVDIYVINDEEYYLLAEEVIRDTNYLYLSKVDDEEDIIAQFENENKESFEEENEMNSVADEMEYDIQFDDPDLESNNEETASDDFSMSFEDETEYKAAPEDEEVPEEEFVEPDFEIEESQESRADIDLEENSGEEENNAEEEIKETILPAAEYGANHEDLKDVFSRMDAEARADVLHNEIREDVAEELAEEETDSENDIVPGQTAVVTENGVEEVVELPLTAEEKVLFHQCCDNVRKHIADSEKIEAAK